MMAAAVTIRVNDVPYNTVSAAQGVSVLDISELRVGAMFGLWGAYRSLHPQGLARGSTFTVIYSDDTSETATVACVGSTVCVIPVPGTQKRDDGALIWGGGGGNNGGGGPVGPTPPGGGVVIVPPPPNARAANNSQPTLIDSFNLIKAALLKCGFFIHLFSDRKFISNTM